ncbi:hypothetical protein L484_008616 [Morus notabilis]|uniref:Ataxin-2 C-terminal domain-containing protein n=1 Tax=Morus notabilis TaxID=981085 RepID=W9S4P5_9ROSA|nr:protein EARLY RESPONSIVE TO DEHYDRATION 15 isoform X2 [Morus notabilis]EXC10450.1 hypothetical protein L484_008616 [Morus notabilis]
MALVSGVRSSLNPNAPLFVPAALRQVEDFSPEWWELVKTSTWFRDYWLSQHQEEDFDGSTSDYADADDGAFDAADILPDDFDIGLDEEFSSLDIGIEEPALLSEDKGEAGLSLADEKSRSMPLNGLKMDAKAILKSLTIPKSANERRPMSPAGPAKYREKPTKNVSPKSTLRRIQQPR